MKIKDITKVSKDLKLLYVEDDALARASTLELLENFFTDITVAINGEDGLEQFQTQTFDIILSDINMPKLNGIEMLRKIREINQEIPVLFLSAYNEASYLLDGISLGVDGYIIKPLNLDQFIITLKKLTDKIILKKEHDNYQKTLELQVRERTFELDQKLHYDELTGLLNRYSFFEDISNASSPVILMIDIDKFKVINEIYGVNTGSLVLQYFAKFLLAFIQGTSYQLYRLSGDEFILFDNIDTIDCEKCENDIKKFFKLLKDFKIDIGDDSISIDVRIGISTSQVDAFESAKIALDYAKKQKKHYIMYSSKIDKRDEERDALAWKEVIKSAIDTNRIVAVYQAIVDENAKISKYETLMRIQEPDSEKLISPFLFLNVAIKTGLYSALSSHIIFEALHLLDHSNHTLSFNFTYGDITNSTLINEIDCFFRLSPELGSHVVFEITESESIENYDDVKAFIKRFRQYGVKIAVDDFGSGFSNFNYILEIEPDYLKIDGSLIKNINTDEKSYVLVKAIVGFSHELGIKVIAEYVHSKEIFEMLKALHVDEYQGFYFAQPIEEKNLTRIR
ncbi:MAG: EAL domain-containing protein [Campylobacterota bacterium]|nr:EAL domain-containing protein [Campylobacterota bacterium]